MSGLARIVDAIDFPMIVVTAHEETRGRSGCLVGFHTQCSIAPARWLVCISKKNHTHEVAASAPTLAVHFLRADQRRLAEIFGDETCDEVDKFAQCAWRAAPDGTPVLATCVYLIGRVAGRFECGDHTAHILDVLEVGEAHQAAPQLGFQSVRDIRPGHPP